MAGGGGDRQAARYQSGLPVLAAGCEQPEEVDGRSEPSETMPKQARKKHSDRSPPAAFVELLTPASGAGASCIVEVESPRGGKLRLELKGIATSEIAQLIHTFAGQ